jgi:hypothetical protein
LAAFIPQTLQAVPVSGNIGFSGAVTLDTSSVLTSIEATGWSQTIVDASSGAFAGIAHGTPVTVASPWHFTSGALPSFWSVGGFTFNLISSSISLQSSLFLDVNLTGTVTAAGFDPTTFTGTFQVANPPANGTTTFTERLSFASVPDNASTVLLFGLTCLGMGLIRYKIRPA